MFAQLPQKERLGYVALFSLLLAIAWAWGYRSAAGRPSPTTAVVMSASSPPLSTQSISSGEVVVDVSGAVRNPGVYRLKSGSRAIDAVKAAGGGATRADLDSVNLAEPLTDGEQLKIPVAGANPNSDSAGSAPALSGGKNSKIVTGQISLNSASLQELEELPGVGPATAQKIVQWRTGHGMFKSIDQLKDVGGIGDKKLARIAPYLKL